MRDAVTSIDEMNVFPSPSAEGSEQDRGAPPDRAQASDPALAKSAAAGDMGKMDKQSAFPANAGAAAG